ncbi:MAG TPA: acyl-CoA dehydrogenase family protein [Candidatus Binataceae bacterium]|nr:acyl-CoA dehydrogenase family protein [Candidatus Binataceae bacterium]
MDFTLSEEDQELVNLIDRIGAERFQPKAFERRNEDGHPIDNMRLLGQLGILGICLPVEFGGQGRDALSGILAIEHIARWCPKTSISATMAIAGPGMFIAKWGTERQKAKYLPLIHTGEGNMSIALTEPQAGSALTDLATQGEIKNGVCRLNGRKTFCSHAGWDRHILVFCRFAPGTSGIGAVIVERDSPGFTISQPHYHISGTPWWELFFDNAEVPEENVLFAGDGFSKLMSSYSLERCAAGASSIGTAQAAFEMARQYSLERKQFGRPICDFQFIQEKLANMYLALEQARLLLYKAVKGGQGSLGRLQSSAAKVAATEAAVFVCDQAMQIFGGSGMSQEMPLEWMYRIVRTATVAGGTSEIHRGMIASELVGRRFNHRLS